MQSGACSPAILFKDCFNYRHKTIRFNRKNRMVYAFRHNGKGGVIEVPWDKAFFFAQRQTSSPLFGGAPTVLRCFVLAEDGKTIVNTFSFGKRTVNQYPTQMANHNTINCCISFIQDVVDSTVQCSYRGWLFNPDETFVRSADLSNIVKCVALTG